MNAERPCTSEEAIAALGYLTRAFGGFSIPDDEQRAFLRLFAAYPPLAVRQAIDELVRTADRRPSPWEVGAKLRPSRPAVRDTRNRDLGPPWTPEYAQEASRRIAELREIAAGVRKPEGIGA